MKGAGVHPYEKFWIAVAFVFVATFVTVILVAAAKQATGVPDHMEMIDPAAILAGTAGWNPGVTTLPDGTVQVTVTARTWSFLPDKIVIPAGKKVIFRATSSDVIHGFDIVGTNVNMELVPGYVNQVSTVFNAPGDYLLLCDEYCGIEHHTMSMVITVKEGI